jgi:cytochrome c
MTSLYWSLCIMMMGAAVPFSAAFAGADDVEKGRELAERLCASCHMQPGQGEKSNHSQIPSFRAVANRPGQSVDGIASWLKIAPPTMPNHHLSHEEKRLLANFIMSLRASDL